MPYKINAVVDRAESERHHTKEHHYMDGLRKRGLLFEMENVLVDADQLVLRTFQCDTNYCVRCTGTGGGREYQGSCCTDLQVDITEREKDMITDLADRARRRLDLKPKDPVTPVVNAVLRDKFTETTEDLETVLLHKRNEACVMSHMDASGQLRCTINTLVDRLGLDLREYKPDPCYLFPLHYAELGQQRFILTVLSEETREWIEQHTAVTKLRCLKTPEPGSPPAYQFLRGEIEYVLGKRFYRELDKLAQPVLASFHRRNGR